MAESWTNPDANMGLYNATNVPAYQNILTNPYFLQALAGIGESLDPEGVGGALGRQAKASITSRQAARANAEAIADANRRHREAIEALDRSGGLTPKGQPGPSAISMGPDGGLTIKIDPETPVTPQPPPQAPNRDVQSSAPSVRAPVSATTPSEVGPPYGTVMVTPPQPITPQGVPTGPPVGPPSGAPSYNEITRPVPRSSLSYPATSVIPFYQAPLRSPKRR